MNIGVIGAGYWGKNHVRVFDELDVLTSVADMSQDARDRIQNNYPHIEVTGDSSSLIEDDDIDGVVISTPPTTHYELAKHALESGKHVLVEKPITFDSELAEELTELADKFDRKLMVGHILLYHPVIKKLFSIIEQGELGPINYSYSTRVNLGQIRQDTNVLWNLIVHDLAIVLEMFDGNPRSVSTTGRDFIQDDIEDVTFMTVYFDSGQLAHFHASWLDPHKIRRLTVVGEEKMAEFDDIKTNNKLSIHDKGIEPGEKQDEVDPSAQYLTTYQNDVVMPHVPMKEPLKEECEAFLQSIKKDTSPLTDGKHATEVVKVLEAGDRSLKENGKQISINGGM